MSILGQTKKLVLFLSLPLSLLLANDLYAIEGSTVIQVKAPSLPQAGEAANKEAVVKENLLTESTLEEQSLHSSVDAAEVDKQKKLLQKAIKDIDSFRATFKYLKGHDDYESRTLLLFEADKFMEDYVNPLIMDESLAKNDDTFSLVANLEFIKSSMYYEAGDYERFTEITENMRKKFGRDHLGVYVVPANERYRKLGEGILILEKEIQTLKKGRP